MSKIILKSGSTTDVLIAQAALETLGFITLHEMDTPEAYIIEMSVPEKFAHIIKEVEMLDGIKGKRK